MTRERIEDFREIVLPFLSRTLLKTNYENMGKSDAEEFEKDFNEILDLAIKALKQEPKEITLEDVKGYCKPRSLTIITNELYHELTHFKINAPERESALFDKIRTEIETKYGQCKLTEYIVQYDGICTSTNDIGDIADILQIIDKYKADRSEE